MADAKNMFVSNRNITVVSLQGYSIKFEKGVPTYVPRPMHAEVMEKGILPCDDAGETLSIDRVDDPNPPRKVVLEPEDADERALKIREVCDAIAARNNPKDFTAGGTPTAKAVTAALGWSVEASEVRPVWQKRQQELAQTE